MDIQIFENQELGAVRCWQGDDGEVVFVASDVAKGLGYADATHLTRILDDDEKGLQNVETLGGKQKMTVITESGFYHAAIKSRVEKAKKFRKWVTSEVLPQIRKTGGYIKVDVDVDGKVDENAIMAKALPT